VIDSFITALQAISKLKGAADKAQEESATAGRMIPASEAYPGGFGGSPMGGSILPMAQAAAAGMAQSRNDGVGRFGTEGPVAGFLSNQFENLPMMLQRGASMKASDARKGYKTAADAREAKRKEVPKYNRSDMNVWEPLIAAALGAFDPTGQFAQNYTATRRGIMDQKDQVDYQNRRSQYDAELQSTEMQANDAYRIFQEEQDKLQMMAKAISEAQDRGVKSRTSALDRKSREEEARSKRNFDFQKWAAEFGLKENESSNKYDPATIENRNRAQADLYASGLETDRKSERWKNLYTTRYKELSGQAGAERLNRGVDIREKELANSTKRVGFEGRRVRVTEAQFDLEKRIKEYDLRIDKELDPLKKRKLEAEVSKLVNDLANPDGPRSGGAITSNQLRLLSKDYQDEIERLTKALNDVPYSPQYTTDAEREAATKQLKEEIASTRSVHKTIRRQIDESVAATKLAPNQKKAPAGQNPANSYRDSASVDKRRQLTRLRDGAFGEFGEFKVEQFNDRDVRGKPGVKSMHTGGRAMDWYGTPEKMSAKVEWLLRQPETGYVIYNKQQWRRTRDGGWVKSKYNGVHGHEDHIHVEPRR